VYGLAIEKLIKEALPTANYEVRLAMRYQNPSIDVAMNDFKKMGLSKIIVLPFFPQYASASTGSVYEEVMRQLTKWQVIPEVRFINNFYDHPKFIEGFVSLGKKYMAARSYDHYIFTYHGLPQRQIRKGDENKNVCVFGDCCGAIKPHNQHCYRAQCFETTRLLVKQLGLKEGQYTTCFQSRLGNDPWIKAYTDEVIKELTQKGIKSVLAFSPSFVADCLETTIEIGEEYKEIFEKNGGQHWQLVESLNDSPIWVETILDLITN
jgi:protoporphyrin/coproporphyrin ferrochelatase